MSRGTFETRVVFKRPHLWDSETDSDFPERSATTESGFQFFETHSNSHTALSDTPQQQPRAHNDEYMDADLVHSSTTDVVADGLHSGDTWSVPQSMEFIEGVMSNRLFLKSLKADEILHLKHVCKSWATWFTSSKDIIVQARSQDDSSDWYFPVLYKLATPAHLFSWTWSGIWHASAEHSQGTQTRPLPSLDCVPGICRQWRHPETVAIAGGLLLIRLVSDIVNVPVRTQRSKREHWGPRGSRFRRCDRCRFQARKREGCGACNSRARTRAHSNWEPLLVVNPLTQAVRFLPAPGSDCVRLQSKRSNPVWSFRQIQVVMRVDEEANSYEVILLYNEAVIVYSSASDTWKGLEFQLAGPWRAPRNARNTEWGYNWACAWQGRRLFVADIANPAYADYFWFPTTAGVLRVFEIDVEAGDWKLHKRVRLSRETESIPIFDVTGLERTQEFEEDLIILRNLELVECLGHLYAVIPARIDEFLTQLPERQTGGQDEEERDEQPPILWWNYGAAHPKYMPLQFFILQLQGDRLVNCVLNIELEPNEAGWDHASRRQTLFDKTKEFNAAARGSNWFSCVAKGSVIWVSCEDYLLQYDVVSGETRTQVVPVNWVEENMRFAYRPSFHMKP